PSVKCAKMGGHLLRMHLLPSDWELTGPPLLGAGLLTGSAEGRAGRSQEKSSPRPSRVSQTSRTGLSPAPAFTTCRTGHWDHRPPIQETRAKYLYLTFQPYLAYLK